MMNLKLLIIFIIIIIILYNNNNNKEFMNKHDKQYNKDDNDEDKKKNNPRIKIDNISSEMFDLLLAQFNEIWKFNYNKKFENVIINDLNRSLDFIRGLLSLKKF